MTLPNKQIGKTMEYCEQPAEETRVERVMRTYRCSFEDAARYLDLRDEGYGQYQAAVMAGISDPAGD